MNHRLSTCLLFGALLFWPLTVRGQQTNSTMARRTILNTPSFPAEGPSETSRGTRPTVSVRDLSIPERARKAFNKGIDRLAKNDPAGSLVHLQRAASGFPNFYEAYYAMGVAQLRLGHEEKAEREFQQSCSVGRVRRFSQTHAEWAAEGGTKDAWRKNLLSGSLPGLKSLSSRCRPSLKPSVDECDCFDQPRDRDRQGSHRASDSQAHPLGSSRCSDLSSAAKRTASSSRIAQPTSASGSRENGDEQRNQNGN
jgi:hypothetical protein